MCVCVCYGKSVSGQNGEEEGRRRKRFVSQGELVEKHYIKTDSEGIARDRL